MDRYIRVRDKNSSHELPAGFHIYKARDTLTDELVAIKIKHGNSDEGIPSATIREISILREISHANVVQLKNCFRVGEGNGAGAGAGAGLGVGSRMCLVFEWLDCDLCMFLRHHHNHNSESLLNPKTVQSFMYQCCLGLAFCHSRGVMHRKLQPQSILIHRSIGSGRGDDHRAIIKLAGFSLARSFFPPIHHNFTNEVITLWYRPPEILLGSVQYGPSVDVFSIGAIFAEMVTKKPLFPGRYQIDQLYRIFRQLGTPDETTWSGVSLLPDWNAEFPRWYKTPFSFGGGTMESKIGLSGVDLLDRCLACDPKHRITAKDCLSHAYFEDLDKKFYDNEDGKYH